MLTTLFFAAAVTALPPLPPGLKSPSPKPLSPKYSETLSSLGTPMAKTLSPLVVIKAPSTTNFLASIQANGNQVTVSWINGQSPYQVLFSPTLLGPWIPTGPTVLTNKTLTVDAPQQFFRIQGNVPLLSITHTNPTTLTWIAPEIDMSDSLTAFKVLDAPSLPANDTPSSETGWTLKTTIQPGQPLTYDDTSPLPRLYKVIEQTANGVVVPYNVQSASGVAPWPKALSGTGTVFGQCVAVDKRNSVNDIVLCGYFSGKANFGLDDKTSNGVYDLFLSKYNAAGDCLWSYAFGGSGTETPSVMAISPVDGSIFVAGNFTSTINVGGINMTSAGAKDIWLAKYNSSGVFQWQKHFGGTHDDSVNAITCDHTGNVLLIGSFNDTPDASVPDIDFGGGQLFNWINIDTFVAKLDGADGHQLWAVNFKNGGLDEGKGIAVDANNNVYVTGAFINYIYFDNAGTDPNLTLIATGGNRYIYFARLDKNTGAAIWAKGFGSTYPDTGIAVVCDSANAPYFAGNYNDAAIDFGCGNPNPAKTGGNADGFLVKLSATDGSCTAGQQWTEAFSGPGDEGVTDMCADLANNIVVIGQFPGSIKIKGTTLTHSGSSDVYVAKLTASGGVTFTPIHFGGSGASVIAGGVDADTQGNIIVCCTLFGTATFAGNSLISASGGSAVLVKLKPDGTAF